MDMLHRICAGLDVHKKTVVACIRRVETDGTVLNQVRTFSTFTSQLLALADWLVSEGVTHVAMESTGVYWKPVFNILEGQVDVMLVNAHHMKNVPGRKTDIKDAEWIAELHTHGLLKPSLIPPPPIREIRDLTRHRTTLVRERATVANRIQKVLESANIKLASVASDPLGVSGRDMIRSMIDGEADPEALSEKARSKLRKKKPELREALSGRVTNHHRFLLRMLMDHVTNIERQISEFDGRIEEMMAPFSEAAAHLCTIPGIGEKSAEVIVAETGGDMSRFPTAGNLASWAGFCPGKNQSGGKRKSEKTTKGNHWLRTTLIQVAWAAAHTKQTIFGALYRRLAKRMNKKKALVALAHKILTIVYKLLKDKTDYVENLIIPKPA